MTNVVAPTMANLINSWCRSAKGRIGRGSRAIVASVNDTMGQCTETEHRTRNRNRRCIERPGHRRDTICAVPRHPTAPPLVVMVGGGQLARMTHQSAIALGQSLRVLAAAPDDPAAQVTPDLVLGSHTDLDDLRRAATGVAALTFDHEHVPTELLDALVAEGVNVAPPPEALVHAQDKWVMRTRLEALGAPVPRYGAVNAVDIVDAFVRRIDGPVVVKTIRGGYDGRGVVMPDD